MAMPGSESTQRRRTAELLLLEVLEGGPGAAMTCCNPAEITDTLRQVDLLHSQSMAMVIERV